MGRFLEDDSHCIEVLPGLPCCNMIGPSPETSSILQPGLAVIAVGVFALVSSLPSRVQVAGVSLLCFCSPVSPSCIPDSQEE